MFSDMPLMYIIVAVVVRDVLSLASVVVVKVGECFVGRSICYSSWKKHGQGTCTSDKLSVVLHTSCARRVRVLIVVALCDVGL